MRASTKSISTPPISESEWKVMKLLWTKAPQPAYDLIAALESTEDWHPNTVRTLLTRLHRKKAVCIQKYKNLYLYSPVVTEEDCIRQESDSFLHRVFGGSVQPLLVHFARREKLTARDLEELKRILSEKVD
jgi:BlaI family transcriptional regulator, penicillinase repressor